MKKRIQFIPSLQSAITAALVSQGVPETVIKSAFSQWHANGAPRTPTETGCFHVFEKVQSDIDQGAK